MFLNIGPMLNKLKSFARHNVVVIQNFSYITVLQVFNMLAPLITYPYLVRILGREVFGLVITAQILVSYFQLIISFGSDSICAKYVSQNRYDKKKLSEIVSSVLTMRAIIWLLSFSVYMGIVLLVPSYSGHFALFALFYGLTFNELLFPQFFFQGIEKMQFSTVVGLIPKLIFITAVFFVVKSEAQILMIPILYGIGYLLSGLIALSIIFGKMKIEFRLYSLKTMVYYLKESSAILATDVITTIKDKFNVILLGQLVGMSDVVIYDLGSKINMAISKPFEILRIVLYPTFACNNNRRALKKVILFVLLVSSVLVVGINIFLPQIVQFFIHERITLWPLRVLLISPIFLSISVTLCFNGFIAFGYTKYVVYSIIITTAAYIVLLFTFLLTNQLGNLWAFITMTVVSYLIEMTYRLIKWRNLMAEKDNGV